MAVIKTVTNGDRTSQFKAVSLGHASAIAFGLCSIIGAQQTWLWAGANERRVIVESIRVQITNDITAHSVTEDRRFDQIDRRLLSLEAELDTIAKQVNINTGKIEAGERNRR